MKNLKVYIMQNKICKNCLTEKPIRLFAFRTRRGDWITAETCRVCRSEKRKYHRFWKPLTAEQRDKNRMTRRAKLAGSPVIIPFTKKEIIRRDGLNCYICGKLLTYETATIDHFIPLSKGGFHCPSNARIACEKCNKSKGNRYGN